jgi:L-lactate dehydrogenase complex protein LldG
MAHSILDPRSSILNRIRTAQGRSGAVTSPEREAVNSHLAAHPRGPQPDSGADSIARFLDRAQLLSTSVDRVARTVDVPQAVARYLHDNALPMRAVCWPQLEALGWQAAGIAVEARTARGDDLIGITGAFCAIAETGTHRSMRSRPLAGSSGSLR